jgi:hypothetical protein
MEHLVEDLVVAAVTVEEDLVVAEAAAVQAAAAAVQAAAAASKNLNPNKTNNCQATTNFLFIFTFS